MLPNIFFKKLIRVSATHKQTMNANTLTTSTCCYCCVNVCLSFLCTILFYVPIWDDASNLNLINRSSEFLICCVYLDDLHVLCSYFIMFFSEGIVLHLQVKLPSCYTEVKGQGAQRAVLLLLIWIALHLPIWNPNNFVLKEKIVLSQHFIWNMGKNFSG